jgi:hypothetical protein
LARKVLTDGARLDNSSKRIIRLIWRIFIELLPLSSAWARHVFLTSSFARPARGGSTSADGS